MWCLSAEGKEISSNTLPDVWTTGNQQPMSLEDVWRQFTQNDEKRNARMEELECLVQGQQQKSEERLTRLEALFEGLQSGGESKTGPAHTFELAATLAKVDETIGTMRLELNALNSRARPSSYSKTSRNESKATSFTVEEYAFKPTSFTVEEAASKLEGEQGDPVSPDSFQSGSTAQKKKKKTLKAKLAERLRSIDKFGEREKEQPKHAAGGCLGIILAIGLAVFAANLYLTYDEVPPSVTNAIEWSTAWGPYPVPLRCFAQDCLISVDVGSATGGAAGCVSELPEAQQNKCIRLSKGESVTVQTCYSFLPMNGVHVQFYGPKAWQELTPDLGKDLGADARHFGVATISDALGQQQPIRRNPTPIRTGTSVAEYVKTMNDTFAENTPGAERHEWFSQLISDTVHQLTNDPCAATKASITAQGGNASSSTWGHSVFQMSPSWTQINVEKPPSFMMAAMGEVGGALELGEQAVVMLLLVVWKFQTAYEDGVFRAVKTWWE